MIKVAYICEPHLGGMYTFFCRIRPALAAYGIDFRAICPFDGLPYTSGLFADEEGVDYLRLSEDPLEVAGAFVSHLKQQDCHAVVILPGAYAIPTELPPYLPASIRCFARVPMMTGGAYRPTIRQADFWDGVFAVSHRVADDLLGRAPGLRDRMNVVYNGVSLDSAEPDWGKFSGSGEISMAYVGRLTDLDKGVRLLPEVLRRVVPRAPRVKLKIAGNGPERGYLEQRFARYGLADHVDFLGGLSLQGADALLRTSPLFILPSRFEGCPNALMEAMGHGCACVASRIEGSVSEIVEDGVSGRLCEVGHAEALADAVVTLASGLDRAEAMGRSARLRIAERFSIEKTAETYAEILQKACKTPARRTNSLSLSSFRLPRKSITAHVRGWLPLSLKGKVRSVLERFSISV